ncbi:hypothetical protein [Celeribacter arenosi]|uniref:Uncharacterized protein n=1 Tax=Celeribacter arenosi TaxID=792649 RepID=A0ABP7KAZ6_9RHOB
MIPDSTPVPLAAVDELATLRAEIQRLKQRESALCDEIRTRATENAATHVVGDTRVAMVETRKTRRIDVERLPDSVIGDESFYSEVSDTHVLLWPTVDSTAHQTPEPEVDEIEVPATSMGEMPVVETETNAETPVDSEPPEANVAPFILSAALSAGATNIHAEDPLPDADFADAEAEEPFELTGEIDGDMTAEIDDTDDTHDEITNLFTIDAETAQDDLECDVENTPEMDAPLDLRPTAHTELSPLGGLIDEDIAAALDESQIPMEPATMKDALAQAEALEAELDAQLAGRRDLLGTDEDDEGTSFFSGRAATGTDA